MSEANDNASFNNQSVNEAYITVLTSTNFEYQRNNYPLNGREALLQVIKARLTGFSIIYV